MRRVWGLRALRVLAAGCLGVDAWVHADLAPLYGPIHAAISEATLFRIEASVAALTALLLVISGRRSVRLFAFLVAASAVGAVLLYRYVDVGTLGPLPNMYEPVWFPEKTLTAVAEGAAALLLAISLAPPFSRPATEKDTHVALSSPDAAGRRHRFARVGRLLGR